MSELKMLSVIIPCYNEEKTIREIIKQVSEVNLNGVKKEIVVINDCSKDNTKKILSEIVKTNNIVRVFNQEKNGGKGKALKRGFKEAKGELIVIQDADLEYSPSDFTKMLKIFIERPHVEVVFGSRFIGEGPRIVLSNLQVVGNKFMTMYSNLLSGIYLTDIHTCYIMFKKEKLNELSPMLNSARFGFNPEIVALIAKTNTRIAEVGIQYYARNKSEGKKIGLKDAIKAMLEITKYNILPLNKKSNGNS